jgi:hypothetical protein
MAESTQLAEINRNEAIHAQFCTFSTVLFLQLRIALHMCQGKGV